MHNSKDSLRDLLVPERSNRLLETAERLVQDMLEQPGEFAVWGAGNSGIYTRRFLEERSGGVLRPSYIVDNNPSLWGRDNIISPEEFFQSGLERITLKSMAAGRENGVLHFEAGVSESCRLSESGTCAVEVCRLDSLPEVQNATILKISTYTSGSLLWESPQYLKKQNPNYHLHFRHYGFGLQAMTCYAIPDGMEG